MASCTVTYGPSLDGTGSIEWVEITNNETGGKRTLDLVKQKLDPRRFRDDFADMWRIITNTDNGATIDLNATQRDCFARMCKFTPPAPAPQNNIVKEQVKRTEKEVLARAKSSTNGNGVDDTEKRINALQEVVRKFKEDPCICLQYDIPTTLNSVCPNPSNGLRFHGFRMTKSVWIIPQSRLSLRYFVEMFATWDKYRTQANGRRGVKYRVLEFSERSMEALKEMAVEALDEELTIAHTALIQGIANADEALAAAHKEMDEKAAKGEYVSSNDRDEAEQDAINAKRGKLRGAGEAIKAAIACAEIYDVTAQIADLLKGLREAHRAAAIAFNQIAASRHLKQVKLV